MQPDSGVVLVSGGAGYIGSHVSHVLKRAGFSPVIVDSLVNGYRWATRGDAHIWLPLAPDGQDHPSYAPAPG